MYPLALRLLRSLRQVGSRGRTGSKRGGAAPPIHCRRLLLPAPQVREEPLRLQHQQAHVAGVEATASPTA